jgi:protein-tyrosine phosphatase
MSNRILFLCTGNYYRSRFAEILFNHLASQSGLNWRADSRGLAPQFGPGNIGAISVLTVDALKAMNVPCPQVHRDPIRCFKEDLKAADLVVALKEAEHRPLLSQHHAGWEDRVEYWHVHDLDAATAEEALPEIAKLVEKLVQRLKSA